MTYANFIVSAMGSSWHQRGNSEYAFIKSPKRTFDEAQSACVAQGGHLVVMETVDESKYTILKCSYQTFLYFF